MSEGDVVCRELRTKAESVVGSLMIIEDRLLRLNYMPEELVTIVKQSGCLTPPQVLVGNHVLVLSVRHRYR